MLQTPLKRPGIYIASALHSNSQQACPSILKTSALHGNVPASLEVITLLLIN